MTGGLPANYGDATGGIISITTRGASRVLFRWCRSSFFWFKNWRQYLRTRQLWVQSFEGVLSGPLFMKKIVQVKN